MKKMELKKYNLRPKAEDLKMIGEEHSWLPETINEKNRKVKMINAMNWLNYVADTKDYRKFVEDWIRHYRPDTSKKDLDLWSKTSDKHIRPTICALARIQVQGFPLTEAEQMIIWEHITEAALKSDASKKEVKGEKTDLEPKIGVQERINNQIQEVIGDVEEIIHNLLRGTNVNTELSSIPGTSRFSAVHYKKFAEALQPFLKEYNFIKDAKAIKNSDDDGILQIKEAYEYVSNKNLKATIQFLEELYSNCVRLSLERKVSKVRKKRPMDKAKIVKKFKYLPKFDEFKLQSLLPVNCLGTSEIWLYNTRTRKIGCYKAEFSGSIMIKGSSFIGYMENSSVQKTLRKPEKQLAEFQSLAKNQLHKWFNNIRSTEHRLNGRSNEHSVIMRII